MTVNRVIVENNIVILEFDEPTKLSKFIEFLRALGVTSSIKRKEVTIRCDEKFKEYLLKDRRLNERTAKDYMNYLRKMEGKTVNYDLYLKISSNKWMVKAVRIYLDYLFKRNEIDWGELQRLKSVFKVRTVRQVNNHRVNPEDLVEVMYDERLRPEELLIFRVLMYGGIRLSEAIKLINEFDEARLECFGSYCRYELFWSRGRKRCDFIYVPTELIKENREYKGAFTGRKYVSITRYFHRKYGVRAKLFRKLFYRLCRQVCDKEICDFYQSRISRLTVGDIYYDDLLSRADKEYPKVVERINQVIDEIKESASIGVPVKEGEIIEIRIGGTAFAKKDLKELVEEDVSESRRVHEFRMAL